MKRLTLLILVALCFFSYFSLAQNSPIGTFDSVYNEACQVNGWAKDPDTTKSIDIHIYKDGQYLQGGTHIASTKADSYRSDLSYTDKNHGFAYQVHLSTGIYDGKDHMIYIYGIDATGDLNVLLNSNPKAIRCEPVITSEQPYTIGVWYYPQWATGIWEPGVYYYYYPPSYGDVWHGVREYALGADRFGLKVDYSNRMPLLGFYDLSQQPVMDTHILQASSRGLSYFAFYWSWNVTGNTEWHSGKTIKKFLSSPYKNKMKFMIAPLMMDGSDWWKEGHPTLDQWKNNIVQYMIDNYLSDPSYLKTADGRPIVDDFILGFADAASHKEAIKILRDLVKQRTGKEPLITYAGMWGQSTEELINIKSSLGIDGFQCFAPGPATPGEPYSTMLSRWQTATENQKFTFHIPCTSTGFDVREAVGLKGTYNTNITPEIFESYLKTMKSYLDNNPSKTSKTLTIYAWNEWSEGGIIEPNIKQGYLYLNIIQKVFGLTPKSSTPSIPPDTIPPSIPTVITAAALSSSVVNLSWWPSIDNFGVSGYKIYQDGAYKATAIPPSGNPLLRLSYEVTGLSPDTTYTYTLSAYDSAGLDSGKSAQASAKTQKGPADFKMPIGEFKTVLISSIVDYLTSQTPKLEKDEVKDLIVAYFISQDVVDLSKIGKFSGKKLSEIYNKVKGV